MPLNNLMQDSVTLIKKDGQRFEGIRASVQPDKIFTDDTSIPLEEGDTFERTLPSGVVERYTVLDSGYHEGIGGIPSHYQSEVRKETKIKPPRESTQIVYNLIGPNARVNIQSVDASTNLVEIGSEDLFNMLRQTIESAVKDKSLCADLTEKVDELEQTQGTRKFTEKYREFITLAADHITVLAPFIPALSQILS